MRIVASEPRSATGRLQPLGLVALQHARGPTRTEGPAPAIGPLGPADLPAQHTPVLPVERRPSICSILARPILRQPACRVASTSDAGARNAVAGNKGWMWVARNAEIASMF